MHSRNLHKNGYDFEALTRTHPLLAPHVIRNPSARKTIDFGNAHAVKALNAALLKRYYHIEHWDIPEGYLCPPIPGRADYIHAIADLLSASPATPASTRQFPARLVGLDIGTGANLIYPIIGSQSYGWHFVASDVDKGAIASANLIRSSNSVLRKSVRILQQHKLNSIFDGVIKPHEQFAFSMCNPPFHNSQKEALAGSMQKNQNIKRNQDKRHSSIQGHSSPKNDRSGSHLNFAGQKNELWCAGGEVGFISRMIAESVHYKEQVTWFTSLVAKQKSLAPLYKKLTQVGALEYKTVGMAQGSKISRFIAWRF
ncbi:23S rRNA (adenine1618-N6)-methyltransferase [Glaciecola punicea ACAM 611]|jgi:23S rRNA (adenine1618-N6)-methyltransferase|uniref:Ribosomal RNA large subunit methyltransferase F n=1 Tax=Glaciecola punicea ACAM 611 TaxID=1121923 RepID=H5TCP1_9ALTE|nr:23S rRNA (adenine(1618)-N(6))-methyltransferase RlmF [Glaciecola punicea]OFA32001.1 23S rRNA (adenine(1618)-N(6))-methyltransferase [Glaciecola punicea]GAB56068.1 23S rRNA (adenine1618-N6)-methyltransferase [Glaciecola punicea ACAM 611]